MNSPRGHKSAIFSRYIESTGHMNVSPTHSLMQQNDCALSPHRKSVFTASYTLYFLLLLFFFLFIYYFILLFLLILPNFLLSYIRRLPQDTGYCTSSCLTLSLNPFSFSGAEIVEAVAVVFAAVVVSIATRTVVKMRETLPLSKN